MTSPSEQAKKVDAAVQADDEPPATIDVVVETDTLPAQKDVAEHAIETFPQQSAAIHAVQLPPTEQAKESEMKFSGRRNKKPGQNFSPSRVAFLPPQSYQRWMFLSINVI